MAAESLQYHRRHDAVPGSQHHHARLATRQALACEGIDELEAAKACKVQRLGGRLKHGISTRKNTGTAVSGARSSWADAAEEEAPGVAALSGAEGSLCGAVAEKDCEVVEKLLVSGGARVGKALKAPLSSLAEEFVPGHSLVAPCVMVPFIGSQLDA